MNSAIVFTTAALAAGAVALSDPMPGTVELEVAGVFPLDDSNAGIVVLRQKGGATLLPIVVGRGEADVVSKRLRQETPTRPRTHELLERTIDALGGRVVRVEIRDVSEAVYRARVFLSQGTQRVELDARPSDSIALAVAARAPI